MSEQDIRNEIGRGGLDRRAWLRRATAGAALSAGIGVVPVLGQAPQKPKLTPSEEAEKERERASALAGEATGRRLSTANSGQYQAVGDAAFSFIKVSLADCELIAQDYFDHYRAKGFDVRRPRAPHDRGRFQRRTSLPRIRPKIRDQSTAERRGIFYSISENWLVLYDIRNEPAKERGGAHQNMRTLAHEATHQLTFNTGLLNRRGDVSFAIFEGLACYSEIRPLHGRSEPGAVNGPLLDALAHIRRRAKWIPAADLLSKDETSFGATQDQTQLAYAQSWLLVYHLMKTAPRLRQFQSYLKTVYTRTDRKHRLEDAEKSFGDLDRLDQELRREAVRLRQAPRP